jgi:hypothetical protein
MAPFIYLLEHVYAESESEVQEEQVREVRWSTSAKLQGD